jgi:hypothetical protein
MSDANTLEVLIKIRDDLEGLKRSQNEVKKLKNEADKSASSLGNLEKGFGRLGLGSLSFAGGMMAVTGAVVAGIKAGVEYNAMLEQQTAKFETLMGSVDAAKQRVEELNKFASSNNLEFSSVARANRLLETMTAGALAGADGMKLIGDAATYADRPIDEVAASVGRLYNGLQNGTPVTGITQRLAEMGVISNDVKRQLDGLATKQITGAQAWAIAEGELAKYSGSMDKQTRTFSGLMGVAKNSMQDFAGTVAKPIFDVFKNSLEEVLVKLGKLPSETEKATKAIEDSTKRIRKSVDGVTSSTKAQTRDDVASELETTKTARDKENRKYLYTPSVFVSREMWDVQKASIAAYDQKIRELQIDLAKFDGLDAKTDKRVTDRIIELEKLREKGEWVTVDSGFYKEEKIKSRGFQGGEEAEYNYLKDLKSAAGTATQTAAKNDAAAAEASTAREVAKEYERIVGSINEWAAAHEKIMSGEQWANSNNQQRLEMLDQELAVADTQLQQKISLAAAAKDETQATAIRLRAEQENEAATAVISGRRRDVMTAIAEEQKKAADEAKRLAAEEKKRTDEANRAASIREQSDLNAIRHQIELANSNTDLTRKQKQEIINGLLAKEKTLLDEIIARRKTLLGQTDNPVEQESIKADINSLEYQSGIAGAGTPKKQRAITNKIDQWEDSHDGTGLKDYEGISAGIMDASEQLGTAGDAISELFSGTIIDSVQAVTDGIYGWITGAESFGDVMRNLGDSIFKEMLNTIIRIGAQWLINTILVRTGIISIGATQDAQRSGQQAKTVASNAAITASAAPGAAATGISSFGMALVFGALALALILAAASAFEHGGRVRGGEQFIRVNERGEEFVVPAHRVAQYENQYGGNFFESIRTGTFDPSGYAAESLASATTSSSHTPASALFNARDDLRSNGGGTAAIAAAMTDTGPSSGKINFAFYDSRAGALDALRTSEGQKVLVDVASDHRAEMGIPT